MTPGGLARPRHLLAALAILTGSVAAAIAVTASSRVQALVAGTAFTVMCIAIVIWRGFRNGRRDLFAPPVLIAGYLALGIGIKGLSDLLSGTSKIQGLLDPTDAAFAGLMTMVFLQTTLAIGAFAVGDSLGARHRRVGEPYSVPGPPLPAEGVRWALGLSLSMTAVGIAVLVGRLGVRLVQDPTFVATEGTIGLFWIYPLLFASLGGWALVIISRWTAGQGASTSRLVAFAATTLTVYFLTTSKTSLILAALYLIVGHHYTVRPARIAHLVLVSCGFLLMLPLLYLHRIYGFTLELFQFVTLGTAGEGFNFLLGRSYLADSFASVLYQTPRLYPFRYGATWLELFYFWIPRGLWPDKPLTESLSFGATYLSSFHQTGASFYAPTLMGDAYLNFGTVGVGAVFLLAGFGLRVVYDRLIGARPHPEGVVLYSLLAYWIAVGAEQSLAVVGELALSYLAPVVFLVIVARRAPFHTASPPKGGVSGPAVPPPIRAMPSRGDRRGNE